MVPIRRAKERLIALTGDMVDQHRASLKLQEDAAGRRFLSCVILAMTKLAAMTKHDWAQTGSWQVLQGVEWQKSAQLSMMRCA